MLTLPHFPSSRAHPFSPTATVCLGTRHNEKFFHVTPPRPSCSLTAFLKKGKGPYMCGAQLTLADCSFAPKLYHTSTCLAQFKNAVISPDLEALHKYM